MDSQVSCVPTRITAVHPTEKMLRSMTRAIMLRFTLDRGVPIIRTLVGQGFFSGISP